MKDRHVPPRVGRPSPAPPPGQDLGQVLREGMARVVESLDNATATMRATNRVTREVGRQEREWGLQEYPDGTGPETRPMEGLGLVGVAFGDDMFRASDLARAARELCDALGGVQRKTWLDVLMEEFLEAAAEEPDLSNLDLDKELVQVAAVAVSWLKNRERRRLAGES